MTTTSGGGTLSLIHGNALAIPLADRSVHLIVTSPPYFALRDYRTDEASLDGQLGSEDTPHHFLAALWAVMDECHRVLRDDGSCWVNLGDKFSSGRGEVDSRSSTLQGGRRTLGGVQGHLGVRPRSRTNTGNLRPKCRMLLPHRFALGLIDPEYRAFEEHRAGLTSTVDPPQWICRMDVVQSKLNGLPESVTDRVRASHESWFHLTKSERYFASMDEIREGYSDRVQDRERYVGRELDPRGAYAPDNRKDGDRAAGILGFGQGGTNALGKLPGSVWEWANEPLVLPDDLPQHFAAFASWPIRRIVSGWSPSGVCVACGEPRRPVCDVSYFQTRGDTVAGGQKGTAPGFNQWGGTPHLSKSATITGYACACPTPDAPTRPAVVLDPFSGTGTAPIVAAAMGRHGVGVDLSWDYHRIARWRDRDGGLRAKALGVDRPERQVTGQLSLLDGAS